MRRVDVNGRTAATLWFGRQFALLALVVRDDKIRAIHWIMNPDELPYLNHQLADPFRQPMFDLDLNPT